MSIYANVTQQDLINPRTLADQQQRQRAIKIKNRILKQTHDEIIAEFLSPITNKLDEVKKSARNLSDIIKESKSENESNQGIVPAETDSEDDIIRIN